MLLSTLNPPLCFGFLKKEKEIPELAFGEILLCSPFFALTPLTALVFAPIVVLKPSYL